MAKKIGILGLGLIGRVAAEKLMPEGYTCIAVCRPSTEDFPDTGGQLVDTARDLAAESDIVISALPSVEASRMALEGPDGLLARGRQRRGRRHGPGGRVHL